MPFDPNAPSPKKSGIFGLPFTEKEAKLILIPVPWEATTSYGGGTSKGPAAIFKASKQVDLFDLELKNFYEQGIAMVPALPEMEQWNRAAKRAAQQVITESLDETALNNAIQTVNQYSDRVNQAVYAETKKYLLQNKTVGIVGGDHSSPFGAIQALLERYPNMGILHFDAHLDLRKAYEGFIHSHASIMYNVMMETTVKKLVQVGIRDFCEAEFTVTQQHSERITVFYDADLAHAKMNGISWDSLCNDIIKALPNEVYISFDIDGLDPRFCPHTGTPVPGGLEFSEALYLIKKVVHSGRKIIGFDLNEVSPGSDDEWDANVGARLLYKLCGWTLLRN